MDADTAGATNNTVEPNNKKFKYRRNRINIKRSILSFILKLAIKYIRFYAKDSQMVRKAKSEYRFAYGEYEKNEMQLYMCNQVIDMLSLLSTQDDSGFSIAYKLGMFNKLVKFKPLTKLTMDDSEFGEPSFPDDTIRQNKRDGSIFKQTNGVYSYIDAILSEGVWYIGDENKVIKSNSGSWSGGMYVIKKDGTMYYARKSYIKDISKFDHQKFTIPTYNIEYPNGWHTSLCRESDLKEFFKYYDFEVKDFDEIENDLKFKDGIYRDEILSRIDTVKRHMKIKTK